MIEEATCKDVECLFSRNFNCTASCECAVSTYRQGSWFSWKASIRVWMAERAALGARFLHSSYCDSDNVMGMVVVDLGMGGFKRHVKNVLRLAFGFQYLWSGHYYNELQAQRNYFFDGCTLRLKRSINFVPNRMSTAMCRVMWNQMRVRRSPCWRFSRMSSPKGGASVSSELKNRQIHFVV